jgi:hypothetical protein
MNKIISNQLERSQTIYNAQGCNLGTISACGPTICYTCSKPNTKNWTKNDLAKGVDQVRKNIYYGAVVCDFQPRSNINTRFCDRNFLNSVHKPPPYEYAKVTDLEYFLKQGESTGCSSFWRFRYQQSPPHTGRYERIGPANVNQE